MAAKATPKTLVESVQAVFDALEPFDESARARIIQSATSLLGQPVPAGPGTPYPGRLSHGLPAGERPLSPQELIAEKKPATNPQKIALFAYLREKSEGLSRFEREDLKLYFSRAKLPPPKNFDRDFGNAVKAGWIYEDGAESYLTSKGLEAVEAGFDGKTAPRRRAPAKGRVRSSKRGTARK